MQNTHNHRQFSTVRRNAPSDRAKFNILTKTDREHNKICKFAEWKTLYQNQ